MSRVAAVAVVEQTAPPDRSHALLGLYVPMQVTPLDLLAEYDDEA